MSGKPKTTELKTRLGPNGKALPSQETSKLKAEIAVVKA